MGNELAVLLEYWHVVLACLAVMYFAHTAIGKLERDTEQLVAAREALQSFYEIADQVMVADELPEALKQVVYDLLLVTTHNEVGKKAYEILKEVMMERPKYDHGSVMQSALAELGKTRPDLAHQYSTALRMAFAALLLNYCHDDASITIEIVRSEPLETAGRFERKIASLLSSDGFHGSRGNLAAV